MTEPTLHQLPGGPALRSRGAPEGPSVLMFGGSSYRDTPGVWSPSVEWLARRIAHERPDLGVVEMRYRYSSWRRLGSAVQDARRGLELLEAERRPPAVLIGFSLGGTVAINVAGAPYVRTVIGLAAWMPGGLDLSGVAGRRLRLLHGTLDGQVPGVPGVRPEDTRRGAERARAHASEVEFTSIAGAVHGLATRAPWGGMLRLPRAGRWAELVAEELAAALPPPAGAYARAPADADDPRFAPGRAV